MPLAGTYRLQNQASLDCKHCDRIESALQAVDLHRVHPAHRSCLFNSQASKPDYKLGQPPTPPKPPLTHLPDLLSDALPLSHPSLVPENLRFTSQESASPSFRVIASLEKRPSNSGATLVPFSIVLFPNTIPCLPSSLAVRAVFRDKLYPPSWMLPNRFEHDLEWKMYGGLAGPSPRCLLLKPR